MLTIDDKKFIQHVVSLSIKNAFDDFYENIFEPQVERSERVHKEMLHEIKTMKLDIEMIKTEVLTIKGEIKVMKDEIRAIKIDSEKLQEAVYELTVIVKNHEKRMQKLETIRH